MLKRASFFILVLALIAGRADAQSNPGGGSGPCVTCVNLTETEQQCVPIPGATSEGCHIYYDSGNRYCSWFGTCNPNGFSMLNVTAAGTVASALTSKLSDGTIITTCNSLIVSHTWRERTDGLQGENVTSTTRSLLRGEPFPRSADIRV